MLEHAHGRSMVQSSLQDLANAPIEKLHHTVGLGAARWRKSMCDTLRGTEPVEGVAPLGLALWLREPVREGWIVVGEQGVDIE